MDKGTRILRKCTRALRRRCPPLLPVRVRTRPFARNCADLGYSMRSGGEFVIVLDARMSLDASILVLLHEWAHCIAWTTGDFTRDHGPEWGIAYARCYCAALGVEWHDNQPGGDRGEG